MRHIYAGKHKHIAGKQTMHGFFMEIHSNTKFNFGLSPGIVFAVFRWIASFGASLSRCRIMNEQKNLWSHSHKQNPIQRIWKTQKLKSKVRIVADGSSK